MAWYDTGTVTVTNGSAAVIGAGTAWVDNVIAGDGFVGADGKTYEIASVNSNTSLTLGAAYGGGTAAGAVYTVFPTQSRIPELTAGVQTLIGDFGAVRDGVGTGLFVTGTLAAPSLRGAADLNTGLFLEGADVASLVTGGARRLRADAAGMIGINGNSDGARLHVHGAGGNETHLKLHNASAVYGAKLVFLDNVMSASIKTLPGNPEAMVFSVAGADTERMRLSPLGLRIGPAGIVQAPLDVEGIWNEWAQLRLASASDGRMFAGSVVPSYGSFVANQAKYHSSGAYTAYDTSATILRLATTEIEFMISTGLTAGTTFTPTAVYKMSAAALYPGADNQRSLGTAGNRYSVVYAATGTINTSDARDKKWSRSTLSDAEIRAGQRIIAELGFFQWLDAIAVKGEAVARMHFGVRAQAVARIFIEEGIEPAQDIDLDQAVDARAIRRGRRTVDASVSLRHGMIAFDTWAEQSPDMAEENDAPDAEEPEEVGADEKIITRSAGNAFGLRMDQLTLYLLRVEAELRKRAEARLDAIDARLAALEVVA